MHDRYAGCSQERYNLVPTTFRTKYTHLTRALQATCESTGYNSLNDNTQSSSRRQLQEQEERHCPKMEHIRAVRVPRSGVRWSRGEAQNLNKSELIAQPVVLHSCMETRTCWTCPFCCPAPRIAPSM